MKYPAFVYSAQQGSTFFAHGHSFKTLQYMRLHYLWDWAIPLLTVIFITTV